MRTLLDSFEAEYAQRDPKGVSRPSTATRESDDAVSR
jgi:hypothetical protein